MSAKYVFFRETQGSRAKWPLDQGGRPLAFRRKREPAFTLFQASAPAQEAQTSPEPNPRNGRNFWGHVWTHRPPKGLRSSYCRPPLTRGIPQAPHRPLFWKYPGAYPPALGRGPTRPFVTLPLASPCLSPRACPVPSTNLAPSLGAPCLSLAQELGNSRSKPTLGRRPA